MCDSQFHERQNSGALKKCPDVMIARWYICFSFIGTQTGYFCVQHITLPVIGALIPIMYLFYLKHTHIIIFYEKRKLRPKSRPRDPHFLGVVLSRGHSRQTTPRSKATSLLAPQIRSLTRSRGGDAETKSVVP
jgi:hypothetical protein